MKFFEKCLIQIMSNYMNYEKAALIYDEARVPAGVDVMCSIFPGLLKKDISEVSLLDVGCGTGNYSLGFLDNGVKDITMVDASEGMLKYAREKTKKYNDCVTIKPMSLPDLDFPDNSFDVISFIQVLHHVDSAALKDVTKENLEKTDYPNLVLSLQKAYHILKPGGVLLLDIMFDENVESFWWTSLCPVAAKMMKQLRVRKKDLIELLCEFNFKNIFYMYYPGDCLVKRDIYDRIDRISDPEWRMYLSQYKLVEQTGELDNLVAQVQKAKETGNLKSFYDKLSVKFFTHGNHSTLYAQKPKN